jgi:hypothetical protein
MYIDCNIIEMMVAKIIANEKTTAKYLLHVLLGPVIEPVNGMMQFTMPSPRNVRAIMRSGRLLTCLHPYIPRHRLINTTEIV